MDHYCKKRHCRKKAILKTLRPTSRQRYAVARPHVRPGQHYAGVGEHSKIGARRACMLSQRSCCLSTTFFLKD